MFENSIGTTGRLILSILTIFSLTGCFGGGGDSATSAPILSSITFYPESAAAGLTINISGTISFEDPDGNLNGGSFNYTYDDTTYSFPLPPEISGITSGMVNFSLDAILSSNTGTVDVPAWLVDNTGNISNTLYMSFTQLWTRQFGTMLEDTGQSVAIDNVDNVLVTGTTYGDLDGESNLGVSDVLVTKYASGSIRLWTRLIGSDNMDNGRGIAVDSSKNIYVTGDTDGSLFDGQITDGIHDGFLTKFDTAGNRVWTKIIGSSGTSDRANAVATDISNSIYVAGSTVGDLDGEANAGSWDVFIVKFDTNGNRLWTRLLGTTDADNAYSVTTDQEGNVYLAGGTEGVLGIDPSPGDTVINSDAFVAKYDSSGTFQWVTQLGTSCSEWAKSIAIDASSNLYIGGKIYQCAFAGNTASGGYDAFIGRLDSTGSLQWVKQFGTADHDSANGVATDSTGNAYVTGYLDSFDFIDDNEGNNIFLAKYDATGARAWLEQEDAGYSWGNQGLSVNVNSMNNIFVTGSVQGQIDGHINSNYGEDDIFILKYDPTGNRH
jgi:hypothetical protein